MQGAKWHFEPLRPARFTSSSPGSGLLRPYQLWPYALRFQRSYSGLAAQARILQVKSVQMAPLRLSYSRLIYGCERQRLDPALVHQD